MTVGIKVHQHRQTSAASSWVINHGLDHKPVCEVSINTDTGLQKILPLNFIHNSDSQLTIVFSEPQTGVARLI